MKKLSMSPRNVARRAVARATKPLLKRIRELERLASSRATQSAYWRRRAKRARGGNSRYKVKRGVSADMKRKSGLRPGYGWVMLRNGRWTQQRGRR